MESLRLVFEDAVVTLEPGWSVYHPDIEVLLSVELRGGADELEVRSCFGDDRVLMTLQDEKDWKLIRDLFGVVAARGLANMEAFSAG